jgi:CBS domain containing-hemolysin-like protein
MVLLLFWAALAIVSVHVCSLLETTLFTVRISTLVDRKSAGSGGAARLLEIKRNHIEDAIGAVLIVNTVASTLGTMLAGAQAAKLFNAVQVGLLSAALIVVLLIASEIIPKTLAARYAGTTSNFAGYALSYLIWFTRPALVVTRSVIRLLARRPAERLTRREFAILVGSAPEEGAISLAESSLIGNLIYSRDVTLGDVMTPLSMVFMLDAQQPMADLLSAPSADAFSRIPLFRGAERHVVGYIAHRDVLKAFAVESDRTRKLESFLRPMPKLSVSLQVGTALEQLLREREAIALVMGHEDAPVGLVTLEDLLEALLGMEITDEADAVENLRPAITRSRKSRSYELRRRRIGQLPPAD